MSRTAASLLPALLLAVLGIAASSCESRRDAERLAELATAEAKRGPRTGAGPQALMVRFEERRGPILAREGWELEVLQVGGDARLRGSLRSPASVIPVAGTLTPAELADLWAELQALPLDGFRVQEDTTAAEEGWIKRLDVDIVLGPQRRIRSRNAWTRPPVGAPWLEDLESLLLAYATEHATSAPAAAAVPDSTREAVDRAVRDAMNELSAPPGDAGATP